MTYYFRNNIMSVRDAPDFEFPIWKWFLCSCFGVEDVMSFLMLIGENNPHFVLIKCE